MVSWPEVSLEEVSKEITVGHVGPMADQYVVDGIPFLRSLNVEPFRISQDDLKFIDASFHHRLRKSTLKPGDVVIVRTGKPGACAVIPDWLQDANCSDLVIVRCNSRVRPAFASYMVNSVAAHHIDAHLVGAVQQHFNVGSARTIRFGLPSLKEQDAIIAILGALDDKIDLNHRMNETLEAMARAIFKDWFVNFGPTRVRREGESIHLTSDILSRFPDRLDDEGKPAGWRLSRLGDEVKTVLGGTPSRAEVSYWGGDIPWINSGKANEFRIVTPSEFITQAGLASSNTKLLPPRTTVIAITGATLGQVSLTEIATCANQSIVGVIGTDTLPGEFIYCWIKENIDRLIASQTGGAQQHINKQDVNELPTLIPTPAVMQSYIATVRPLFEKIKIGCLESLTLSATRNFLLPKLISGEVRVKEAEIVAGAAQ